MMNHGQDLTLLNAEVTHKLSKMKITTKMRTTHRSCGNQQHKDFDAAMEKHRRTHRNEPYRRRHLINHRTNTERWFSLNIYNSTEEDKELILQGISHYIGYQPYFRQFVYSSFLKAWKLYSNKRTEIDQIWHMCNQKLTPSTGNAISMNKERASKHWLIQQKLYKRKLRRHRKKIAATNT